MADNKIVNNPPFTEDTPLDTSVDEGQEGETKVVPEEEDKGKEAPTEPTENLEEKQKEAIERDLGNIQSDISQLELKRQQILEARKQRRTLREDIRTLGVPEELNQDDLSDIDQEDIKRLDRVLRSKGFVSKSEVQETLLKQAQQEVEDSFFTSHPEYSVSSDSNDLLYNSLKEEIVQFAKPQTVASMKRVLERAHKAVQERFPQSFLQKGSLSTEMAKQHRKEVASIGGGTTSSRANRQTTLTETQKQELLKGGFSEEEIAEM